MNTLDQWLKFAIGWLVVFTIRLVPFRPPNIEPVMATLLPYARHYGRLTGFIFAFLSIALFDLMTAKLGIWTLITGLVYGLVGLAAGWWFNSHRAGAIRYAVFAAVSTILYDAVTGLSIGPLFFGQSLVEAFWGQIPFTVAHLSGNIVLALALSPLLDRWIVTNSALDWSGLYARLTKRAV